MKSAALLLIMAIPISMVAQQRATSVAREPAKIIFIPTLANRGSGEWTKELVRILIDSPLVVKDGK